MDRQKLERVRVILLDQAEMFDDAASYAAGVEDALDALVDLTDGAQEGKPLTVAGGWFG